MLKFNKVFMYITASALSVSLWTCTSFAIETSNGWYKISYNGKTGWVYGSYVKVTETPKLTVTDETILATLSAVNNSSSQVVDETIQKKCCIRRKH